MTPGETLPPIQLPPEVLAEIENNKSIREGQIKPLVGDVPFRPIAGATEHENKVMHSAELQAASDKICRDIECRFTYHAPKPGQPELYQALREQAKALAYRIVQTVPPGREQASALTFLENAVMWANAGIARAQ